MTLTWTPQTSAATATGSCTVVPVMSTLTSPLWFAAEAGPAATPSETAEAARIAAKPAFLRLIPVLNMLPPIWVECGYMGRRVPRAIVKKRPDQSLDGCGIGPKSWVSHAFTFNGKGADYSRPHTDFHGAGPLTHTTDSPPVAATRSADAYPSAPDHRRRDDHARDRPGGTGAHRAHEQSAAELHDRPHGGRAGRDGPPRRRGPFDRRGGAHRRGRGRVHHALRRGRDPGGVGGGGRAGFPGGGRRRPAGHRRARPHPGRVRGPSPHTGRRAGRAAPHP